MLPCLGGPRWWPLTAKAGLFHAPLDQVVKAAQPWKGGPDSPWRAVRHPHLEAALAAHTPYSYGREQAVFAVASRDGDWTAVCNSAVPGGDVVAFLQARALFDVHSEFVGVEWLPGAGDVFANATFAHFRPEARKLFRSPKPPGDT